MYKQRCVQVLKKRKQYDNQLKGYMNQQFTLDQVAFTSDNIQNTIEMVKFMLLRPKLWRMQLIVKRMWWEV
jgi:hypothetical protein